MEHINDFQSPKWQATCPLPPMPDLTTPDRYHHVVMNGGIQNASGMYAHGFVAAYPSYSPFQSPHGYNPIVFPRATMSEPPTKRKPGRPKIHVENRAKYSSCKSLINEAGVGTGKKRGRKPGTKNGCGKKSREAAQKKGEVTENGEPIVRTKRKYTRRIKAIDPREKPITDIVQLTESLVNVLLPPEENKPITPDLGDLCLTELENLVWAPEELLQEDDELDEEDIKAFNDLLKELTFCSVSEQTRKNPQHRYDSKSDTNHGRKKGVVFRGGHSKQHGKSTVTKPPRTNVLNCRRKAIRKSRRSILDDDNNTAKPTPSTNTWNCKIGGKCANKWQLLQKHVLGNKVVKQLREERQTERLIKVLCSTPQRTLRTRPREGDESLHDASTTSTETASPDKSTSSWMTANDTSLNATGNEDDISPKQISQGEAPEGFFAVEGGVCPEIEPTLNRETYIGYDGALYYGNGDFTNAIPSYSFSFAPLHHGSLGLGR